MKKLFCFVLVALMTFVFCACSEKEEEKPKYTAEVDVKYYAELGQIPETEEYKLGFSVEDMLSDFAEKESQNDTETADHSHAAFGYSIMDNDEMTSINTGNFEYCYKNEKRDEGVSCILSFEKSYGFENGTIIIEVKEALSDYDVKEEYIGEEGAPFMPYVTNADCLTYTFGKNKVTFIFTDNALSVTALYRANEWSLK